MSHSFRTQSVSCVSRGAQNKAAEAHNQLNQSSGVQLYLGWQETKKAGTCVLARLFCSAQTVQAAVGLCSWSLPSETGSEHRGRVAQAFFPPATGCQSLVMAWTSTPIGRWVRVSGAGSAVVPFQFQRVVRCVACPGGRFLGRIHKPLANWPSCHPDNLKPAPSPHTHTITRTQYEQNPSVLETSFPVAFTSTRRLPTLFQHPPPETSSSSSPPASLRLRRCAACSPQAPASTASSVPHRRLRQSEKPNPVPVIVTVTDKQHPQ
jgi:hypothetical protein